MATNKQQPAAGGNDNSGGGDSGLLQKKELGRYQLQRKLGAGGMGTVFLALDTTLNRLVALKILPPDKAENQILVKRFKAEAQAVAQLTHENIVRVYESGEIDGYHFISLEYVEGTDVQRLIKKRGRLPIRRTTEIITQVAMALEHAYQAGIVHRDIKPANMLITQAGVVKLTDLGLARILDENTETSITRAGTTVGTVDYMAPEQARSSKAADIRSDIYSLGCAWYHMLTGLPPYPEGSVTNKLHAHVTARIPDPRSLNEGVPESVVGVIQRMMAKNPEERHQTPLELLDDLKAVKSSKKEISANDLAALAGGDEEIEELPASGTRSKRRAAAVDSDDEIPVSKKDSNPRNSSSAGGAVSSSDALPPRKKKKLKEVEEEKSGLNLQPLVYVGAILGVVVLVGVTISLFRGIGSSIQQEETAAGLRETAQQVQEERSQEMAESGTNSPMSVIQETPVSQPAEQTPPKPVSKPRTALAKISSAAELLKIAEQDQWPVIRVVNADQSVTAQSAHTVSEALSKTEQSELVIELASSGIEAWETPIVIEGKTVIIKPAEGSAGTIVVNSRDSLKDGLITVKRGELLLDRLHFGLLGYDLSGQPDSVLLKNVGSHVIVQGCSFTLEESLADPVTLCHAVQDEAAKPVVLWERCLVRGAYWKPFLLSAWAGGIQVSDSLFVLGDQPVLSLQHPAKPVSASEQATQSEIIERDVQFKNSAVFSEGTPLLLTNSQNDLQVPATQISFHRVNFLTTTKTGNRPFFHVVSWPENVLGSAGTGRLSYLSWFGSENRVDGWGTFLAGKTGNTNTEIAISDQAAWDDFWKQPESAGQVWSQRGSQPLTAQQIEQVNVQSLQPLGLGSLLGSGQISLQEMDQLSVPVLSESTWRGSLLKSQEQPLEWASFVNAKTPRLRVDANRQDLGEFIAAQDLPPAAVIEVRGFGLRTSSPILISGRQIRLEFISEKGKAQLAFRPVARKGATVDSRTPWIQVDQASLEISRGVFRVDPPARNPLPTSWLNLSDSEVRLENCHVTAPLVAEKDLAALIVSRGTGATQPLLSINNSYLQYGGTILDVDLQRQKLKIAGSLLVSPLSLAKLKYAQAGEAGIGRFEISKSTLSVGSRAFDFEVADPGPYHQPLVYGQISESVFVPPVSDGKTKITPLLVSSSVTLQDLAKRIWWWEERNGYSPELFESEKQAEDWQLRVWGSGQVKGLLFSKDGVILKNGNVGEKNLRPSEFALFESSKAAKWGADEKPIGADCQALELSDTAQDSGTTPATNKPAVPSSVPRF